MKNLGFVLDLVAILLIGNKITYINEHIKFKHFKEPVSQKCFQPIIFKNMEIVSYFTNLNSFCLCKSCIKGKEHKEWAPQEGAIRTSLLQVGIIHFHIYMVSNAMNCHVNYV